MARLARAVFPGIPHHVTQRGNGRAQTFFCDDDYALYRDLLAKHAAAAAVEVWAWVLMPNHVHLILVPSRRRRPSPCAGGAASSLCRPCPRRAEAHRAFLAGPVRLRGDGRGASGRRRCAMWRSIRCARGWPGAQPDWRWSSVHAHLGAAGRDHAPAPVRDALSRFRRTARGGRGRGMSQRLRQAETIGRPIGDTAFLDRLDRLEHDSGRVLNPPGAGGRLLKVQCHRCLRRPT